MHPDDDRQRSRGVLGVVVVEDFSTRLAVGQVTTSDDAGRDMLLQSRFRSGNSARECPGDHEGRGPGAEIEGQGDDYEDRHDDAGRPENETFHGNIFRQGRTTGRSPVDQSPPASPCREYTSVDRKSVV